MTAYGIRVIQLQGVHQRLFLLSDGVPIARLEWFEIHTAYERAPIFGDSPAIDRLVPRFIKPKHFGQAVSVTGRAYAIDDIEVLQYVTEPAMNRSAE